MSILENDIQLSQQTLTSFIDLINMLALFVHILLKILILKFTQVFSI